MRSVLGLLLLATVAAADDPHTPSCPAVCPDPVCPPAVCPEPTCPIPTCPPPAVTCTDCKTCGGVEHCKHCTLGGTP